jgi:transposase
MREILTKQQKEELITRHKGERDRRICDRIKAVIMYDEGYSVEEISKVLLLSDEAIRKHLRDYQKHSKLHTNNGGGFAKLDESSQQKLSKHLEENNYVLVKDICAYVENKYGLEYTVSGMTRLLYRMGFVYKKPKLVPGKLDINRQEEFRLQYKLLKSNLKVNEAIYFMDSVHPQS